MTGYKRYLNMIEGDPVGNPYMVNAGCEIPSGTPEENLSALCDPIPYGSFNNDSE
jgi:uroporphyrinogen-III decarboxylase